MASSSQSKPKNALPRKRAEAARGPGTRTTKKDQLIRFLSTKTGAAVPAISLKLGWQQHTTRAALTGLRKAGYEIASEKPGQGKPARYRITARPGAAEVAAPSTGGGASDAG